MERDSFIGDPWLKSAIVRSIPLEEYISWLGVDQGVDQGISWLEFLVGWKLLHAAAFEKLAYFEKLL